MKCEISGLAVPRAAVFDLGKVLLDFDYRIVARRLAGRCRLSAAELGGLIDQSPLLLQYECGTLSTAEFFSHIRQHTGFSGDPDDFSQLFGDIFTPITPMVELQGELRRRGVPTYIFSNTNELAVNDIRKRHPFFANFDGYVLSYEHRAMKPAPALYAVVERITGCRGPEIFYLDDRPENIVAARERGWRALQHRDIDESRAAVARAFRLI